MAARIRLTGFDVYEGTERKDQIEEAMRLMSGIIPSWCSSIHVRNWDHDHPESNGGTTVFASCSPQYEYRKATINLLADFWNEPPENRWNALIHEVCHIVLAPITTTTDILVPEKDSDGDDNMDYPHYTACIESATQDLADILEGYLTAPVWAGGPKERFKLDVRL